jgi:8-oxo-dGTP pyrophosphatase MutT (NUDIX family)
LPGGGVKRGEDPQAAAIRELYEETKVRVDPTEVSSAVVTKCYGARLVFEVELRDDPELRVDQREIVAAAFVAPMGLNETNTEVRRYLRMRAIERAKTVVISDHHG